MSQSQSPWLNEEYEGLIGRKYTNNVCGFYFIYVRVRTVRYQVYFTINRHNTNDLFEKDK